MEEIKESKEIEDPDLAYLLKVYGENTLKSMIEDWKKEIIDEKLEDWIKKKIIKQVAYLKSLRNEAKTI